jgi:predicted dehydrogenase
VVSATVNRTETFQYDYSANFVDELEDFSQAVTEDRDPRATGLDGLATTLVTAAAVESARTGRAVKVLPVDV